jgi:hypothetical protein
VDARGKRDTHVAAGGGRALAGGDLADLASAHLLG